MSPRVSPMMRVADAGNLLAGAGFGLPLVDTDSFTVEYPSAAALFHHLRAMGESNAALGARPGVRRDTLLAAAAAYSALYGDAEGRVPATFQVIYVRCATVYISRCPPPRPRVNPAAPHPPHTHLTRKRKRSFRRPSSLADDWVGPRRVAAARKEEGLCAARLLGDAGAAATPAIGALRPPRYSRVQQVLLSLSLSLH